MVDSLSRIWCAIKEQGTTHSLQGQLANPGLHGKLLFQESRAIAKKTARCALYMDALKNFGSPWLRLRLLFTKLLMGFCCNRSYECACKIWSASRSKNSVCMCFRARIRTRQRTQHRIHRWLRHRHWQRCLQQQKQRQRRQLRLENSRRQISSRQLSSRALLTLAVSEMRWRPQLHHYCWQHQARQLFPLSLPPYLCR